jgi:hypothetical protein
LLRGEPLETVARELTVTVARLSEWCDCLRVSTVQQARSGLGIEAQREAIVRFIEAEDYSLAGEFVEVQTGKGADALDCWTQLVAALAQPARRSARW